MNKYLTEPQQPKWNEITYQSMKRDCMTRRRRFRIHIELKHSSNAEEKWKWKDSIYSKLKFPSKLSMHMVKDPLWITFHSIGLAITDWFMTLSSAAGWPLRRHRLVSSVPLFSGKWLPHCTWWRCCVVTSAQLAAVARSWNVSRTSWASHIYIVKRDLTLRRCSCRCIAWYASAARDDETYSMMYLLFSLLLSFGRSYWWLCVVWSIVTEEARRKRWKRRKKMSNCLGDERNSCFSSLLAAATCSPPGHRLSFGNDEEIN